MFTSTEPLITIDGVTGRRKTFSADETNIDFIINVYSTSRITSFEIVKDGGYSGEIYSSFLSFPEFEIITQYQIGIPVLDDSVNGKYTISVKNRVNKTSSQKVKLIQAESKYQCNIFLCKNLHFHIGLVISIVPNKMEVVEGFLAVFECLVSGNLVDEIKWSRDYEPLHQSKVSHGSRSWLYIAS